LIKFSPKDEAEEIYYGADFAAVLSPGETIVSASATIRVLEGTDPTPGAMIVATTVFSGSKAEQFVVGGVPGTRYKLAIHIVTSRGQKFIDGGPLSINQRD